MPAHKRSWSDSLVGEELSDEQFSHQDAKQCRAERQPNTEVEEEEEEEEQKKPKEEAERVEKQHKQLEEGTGARGYVTSIAFPFVRFVVLVLVLSWFSVC